MGGDGNPEPARPAKRASAFRTIGEVAADLDVPAHVLRFWEAKFPQLKPLKRGGGRRYYRPEDVALLRRIRQSLYTDGYTIRGVQQLLAEPSAGDVSRPEAPGLFPLDPLPVRSRRPPPPTRAGVDRRSTLETVRRDLLAARALLADLLPPRRGS